MNIAVIGGDFRSLILAYKLKLKGNNICLFCGEENLGGFLRGINIFDNILDLGPQYLDNFTSSDIYPSIAQLSLRCEK